MLYLGARAEACTTDVALSMFHQDRRQAIAAYRRFVEQPPPGGASSPLAQLNPNDARVLGDDQFLARVLAEAWRPRSRKTLQQLAEEACQQFCVDLALLQSGARQRQLTAVRAWIAHQALKQRIGSVCEVARFLNRSESALRECLLRHHPPERQTRDTRDPAS
jgi:hypothetical protein